MQDKKVKILNPNNFIVGLRLMDGIREIPVHPKSFVILDSNDVFYINNMCTLFKTGVLTIDDAETNEALGFTDKVFNISDEEIKKILTGYPQKMKKSLEAIREKHILDRVVQVAKEIDLPMSKLRIVEEITGYDFDQLIKNDEE